MSETMSVKHFTNIGDIIASLISVKKIWTETGKRVIYCQQLDVPGMYYQGASHPTLDENNIMVMCNKKMWDMMKPLLLCQEYIADAQVYEGQPIDIDFTLIRENIYVNMPNQAIQQWIFLAFPELASDISKQWIDVGGGVDISSCKIVYPQLPLASSNVAGISDKIILNFTDRYRNYRINYFFLKHYQDRLIFSGTQGEYEAFIKKWGVNLPYLVVDDFLQLAYIIKQCKFVLSNQSFIWNLCEAMKTPRLLELCDKAPNCQSFIGEDSLGFLHQIALEHYFNKMINKK